MKNTVAITKINALLERMTQEQSVDTSVASRSKNSSVSVVIRTYNRAGMLLRAIESVLQQDYNNFELIVVDDGSTDNTVEVLDSIRSRIRYCYQTNQGLAAGREKGLSLAEGQYIIYLDSDDWWKPGILSRMVPALDSTGAGFAFCDWEYSGRKKGSGGQPPELMDMLVENGVTSESERFAGYFVPHELTRKLFMERIASAAPTGVMMRRECLSKNFNTIAKIADDWVAVLDLIIRQSVPSVYFSCPLWMKSVDGTNIYDSSDNSARAINFELSDLLWVKKAFRNEISMTERKGVEGRIADLFIDRAYWRRKNDGQRSLRIRDCLQSFRARPSRKAMVEAVKSIVG